MVWVPDPELAALDPGNMFGSKQVLQHLEEWDATEWGLPKITF